MYWSAAEQKTCTLRRQKESLFDWKFCVEPNSFYKEHEVA